jgi:CRP-like cAMP-binding protein
MTDELRVGALDLTSKRAVEAAAPDDLRALLFQRLDEIAAEWRLPPRAVPLLADSVSSCAFAPDETILPYGAQAGFLGMIARGEAAAYTSHRPDARQVAVLLPGSTFGHNMLASDQPSRVAIRAQTSCDVWILNRSDVEALIRKRRSRQRTSRRWGWVAWGGALLLVLSTVLMVAPELVWQALSALLTAWFPHAAIRLAPAGTGPSLLPGPGLVVSLFLGGGAVLGVLLLAVGLVARRMAQAWT